MKINVGTEDVLEPFSVYLRPKPKADLVALCQSTPDDKGIHNMEIIIL